MQNQSITARNKLLRKCEKLLQNLQNEQEREESIFTLVPVGISIATDVSCQEIIHNPEAANIIRIPDWDSFSHSNPPQTTVFKIYRDGEPLLPQELPLQQSAWENKHIDNMELELRWGDGVHKTIQTSSRPLYNEKGEIIGALATTKEITNLKALQAELKQHKTNLESIVMERTEALRRMEQEIARLDRLDLVGEIAASIGHEVRNPMTTIRGYLQLLAKEDNKEVYKVMIEELDRANAIITEFLSLAKPKEAEFLRTDLNEMIETLFPLFEANGLIEDKQVKTELGEIPELTLSCKLIRQLLMNLVRNGFQAMAPSGTITIRTCLEDGDVILSVQDQGQGIPPENREKIGNPFFTTKEDGTGLGLSVCYSIAQRHNAKIDFISDQSGTTFFVRFKQTN